MEPMPEVAYLSDAGAAARQRVTGEFLREVEAAIERDGQWKDRGEWRISTYMTRRIAPVEAYGKWWFEVTVKSGNEMVCHAPTLERALEFMFVFERLVMDLFWTLGWPSWAGRRGPNLQRGDTAP
jgi:hypothetical protein